jgi:hypothetical protein
MNQRYSGVSAVAATAVAFAEKTVAVAVVATAVFAQKPEGSTCRIWGIEQLGFPSQER